MESFDWRQWRRLQALHLSENGWAACDIAMALGVTQGSVSQWLASVRRAGSQALYSHPHPGRRSKLNAEQIKLIPDFLWHGAEAYGLRGDVWTCTRVAWVVEQEFGIRYSASEVSRILKRIGWTPQVPLSRAIQRDEEAIERWRVNQWPQIQERAHKERRTLILLDESGFYLLPGIVKTYAPEGQTPLLEQWLTRDHLSVMGAVSPQGKAYSLVRQQSLNGLHTVEFLLHLLRVVGRPLLVVWDGSPIHRRGLVAQFLAEVSQYIQVERFPPYAPDLNPAERMWAYLKGVEMRNITCLDLEQLHQEFHFALGRLRQKPRVILSFFDAAGLPLNL